LFRHNQLHTQSTQGSRGTFGHCAVVDLAAKELQVKLVRSEAVAAGGDPQGDLAIRAGDGIMVSERKKFII